MANPMNPRDDAPPIRHVGDARRVQQLKIDLMADIERQLTIADAVERAAAARAHYRQHFPLFERAVIESIVTYGWVA